ncbi:MAG: yliI [Fibrobacteres bacterium]|nr:yliI [Fibrobacterota bacterium]
MKNIPRILFPALTSGARAFSKAAAIGSVILSQSIAAGFNYWNVEDTAKAPRTLSATGVYTDIKTGKMIPEAQRFEVNSPLWSDGAHKQRWVLLKPGRTVAFDEKDDYWGYPDSTVFVKQFDIDTIPGDTTSRRVWETRLLVNKMEITDPLTGAKTDKWYGFSYKWNDARTEGFLVGFTDKNDAIRIYPQGKGKPSRMKKWTFPAEHCDRCHLSRDYGSGHSRSVLGFFTAQLNRPSAANPSINQLDELFAKGVLKGSKPANWNGSARWRAIDDASASLNVRARSYFAANCSGCHGRRGNLNGAADHCDINFDYQNMNDSLFEFRHRYSGPHGTQDSLPFSYPKTDLGNNPRGLGNLEIQAELIVPGYPQKSAILARAQARNTTPGDYDPEREQMPPWGSFEVNDPAMAVIREWIKAMPATPAPGWDKVEVSLMSRAERNRAPVLMGRTLVVPEGVGTGGGDPRVRMSGIDGRSVGLRAEGRGVYSIPGETSRGLYFIRVGALTYRRQLL